jgi:hypothetical protein
MFAFGSWQGTAGSQRLELILPNLGTIGYHYKELPIPKGWNWWFPTWEPKVTMTRSQKLEFILSKLRGNHCKELRVPKVWNSLFQTKKIMLPIEVSVHCKKLHLMGLNVVLFCFWAGSKTFSFAGCWAGIRMFLHENTACRNDMTTLFLQFYGFV